MRKFYLLNEQRQSHFDCIGGESEKGMLLYVEPDHNFRFGWILDFTPPTLSVTHKIKIKTFSCLLLIDDIRNKRDGERERKWELTVVYSRIKAEENLFMKIEYKRKTLCTPITFAQLAHIYGLPLKLLTFATIETMLTDFVFLLISCTHLFHFF